jgi:hypothetical protein
MDDQEVVLAAYHLKSLLTQLRVVDQGLIGEAGPLGASKNVLDPAAKQ